MASIFATTAEVQRKSGASASTVSNVEAYIDDYMTQAESFINVKTKKNWSDDYAGLNVDVKGILKRAAASLAAIDVIIFDMSGFTSRAEARLMINVLKWESDIAISELEKKDQQDFMVAA